MHVGVLHFGPVLWALNGSELMVACGVQRLSNSLRSSGLVQLRTVANSFMKYLLFFLSSCLSIYLSIYLFIYLYIHIYTSIYIYMIERLLGSI